MFPVVALFLLTIQLCVSEKVIVDPGPPILKGALIDDYETQVLIIRISHPTDIIEDAMKTLNERVTSPAPVIGSVRKSLDYLEQVYSKRFNNIFDSIGTIRSIFKINRAFWKSNNQTTILGSASAAIFVNDLADAFGNFPEERYKELSPQIEELHKNRSTDMQIMRNATLITMQMNTIVTDAVSDLNKLLLQAGGGEDGFNLTLKGSGILSTYLDNIQESLSLVLLGQLPSTLLSIDNQKLWLKTKISSALLNSIETMSPHLAIELKAIDVERNQIVLTAQVPKVFTKLQLLNYVRWEPKITVNKSCYSSPVDYFYIAYNIEANSDLVENPLLIDPQGCLQNGFIMCKSDAILEVIPNLTVIICDQVSFIHLYKASVPSFDVSALVSQSLEETMVKNAQEEQLSELKSKIYQGEDDHYSQTLGLSTLMSGTMKEHTVPNTAIEKKSKTEQFIDWRKIHPYGTISYVQAINPSKEFSSLLSGIIEQNAVQNTQKKQLFLPEDRSNIHLLYEKHLSKLRQNLEKEKNLMEKIEAVIQADKERRKTKAVIYISIMAGVGSIFILCKLVSYFHKKMVKQENVEPIIVEPQTI